MRRHSHINSKMRLRPRAALGSGAMASANSSSPFTGTITIRNRLSMLSPTFAQAPVVLPHFVRVHVPVVEAYLWERHTDENTNLFGISRPQPRLRDFGSSLRQCARLLGARDPLRHVRRCPPAKPAAACSEVQAESRRLRPGKASPYQRAVTARYDQAELL